MKRCSKCGQDRPLTEFQLRKDRPNARRVYCRACKIAYDQEWYRKNASKHRRVVAAANAERRRRTRQLTDQAKGRPCADCGRRYPAYVMDFDHVRDVKLGNISRMQRSATVEKLQEEIDKCDVVCANCHRIRTYGRRREEKD